MVRLHDLHGQAFEDYLSRIYLTMLRLNRPTVEALVGEGYHPEDVERAGRALEDRELIDRTGPQDWDVRPPESALPKWAAEMEARAAISRAAAAELGVLWRQARQVDDTDRYRGFEVLGGIEDILVAASSVEGLADRELQAFLDGSPVSLSRLLHQPVIPNGSPLQRAERRTVIDVSLLEHPGVLSVVEQRVSSGEQVRVARGLPFSGLVADTRAALVDLSRYDPAGDGSFVVRRPAAVQALRALFERAFELATPMAPMVSTGEADQDERAPLSDRDQRVLRMLATGASDQLIARQLGASTRTIERRVRYLMNHLGATTRFQAGVQAVRRGWL